MKKVYILMAFFMLLALSLSAQSIRKEHLEMTATEKVNLVNAFYQLRTGADLIADLAEFHADFFVFENTNDPNGLAIHFNLPDRPENQIFFAWHRRQMFELEQVMQDINPNISMPFWDSSTDQSVNSTLWDQNFMGQFDADWGLGRNVGAGGPLPTLQTVIDVQANTDFLLYSNDMERGDAHTGGHRYAGGVMRTSRSPRDPIFYLHHTYVDKLWTDWEEANQNSSFIIQSMIRYDGTYNFDGTTLPLVNPNNIVDSKSLGVFYAHNQLAELENYTVSNTYNTQENFYYQFTIQAGNSFMVPTGTDCKLESVTEIVLQPGFEAVSGSSFTAKIDNVLTKSTNQIVRNQIPFDNNVDQSDVYSFLNDANVENVSVLKYFPNPFTDKINIQLSGGVDQIEVTIYNLMGQAVKQKSFNTINNIEINNLNDLASGIYIIKVINKNDNKTLMTEKIIK
jgi:tyrosinase